MKIFLKFFEVEIFESKKKVLRNIQKTARGQKMKIIEGFYKNTIENKTTQDLKIDKARVVMIDCDLKGSARLALEFIKPSIQEGTILLFDDFVFFKGNFEAPMVPLRRNNERSRRSGRKI